MLCLIALSKLTARSERPVHDLLAESRAALGHLGLTIIALVFVLLSFWRG